MNYEQSIEYIHSLLRFGVSPGLERITALLEKLGNPQNGQKFVHVAGTNGKGTTSTMLSEMLKRAGLVTGLFTSPYVVDFCERIQINNEYVSHDELAVCVTAVKAACDELNSDGIFPTEFEAITAAGLLCFKRNRCDISVLECGMGGEHDSTNVIGYPEVAVFTSISLDHMQMLGATVGEIAAEKSGIIKSGCRVVCYPDSNNGFDFVPQQEIAVQAIASAAERKGCSMTVADSKKLHILSFGLDGIEAQVNDIKVHIPFIGTHQAANALTAVCAAEELKNIGYPITSECIREGIEHSRIPARLEITSEKPLTLLDGGHNEGCIEAVCAVLDKHLSSRRLVVLAAFMKDKQCDVVLEKLMPYCAAAVFTTPRNPRSCPASVLAARAEKFCSEVYSIDDSCEALDFAEKLVNNDDVLLVCGSFYLAGEVRNKLLGGR